VISADRAESSPFIGHALVKIEIGAIDQIVIVVNSQ
jgi:hypothetical protein